jgi:hypothetical protein
MRTLTHQQLLVFEKLIVAKLSEGFTTYFEKFFSPYTHNAVVINAVLFCATWNNTPYTTISNYNTSYSERINDNNALKRSSQNLGRTYRKTGHNLR